MSPAEAQNFLCDGLESTEPFPLDRLWIAPTNGLAEQVNQKLQAWRATPDTALGSVRSLAELIPDRKYNPGLSECRQSEFIEMIDTLDLPPHISNLHEGDRCMILRNIRTLSGLVKRRRCWARKAGARVVWGH
jgi:hypothetical protein